MREKGEILKAACETLRTSRSAHYRKAQTKNESVLNKELIEKLKELRLGHPFWGYRRMTAWLHVWEGYAVNRKLIPRLVRENGLRIAQVRHKTLRTSVRSKPTTRETNPSWGIDMTKFVLSSLGWYLSLRAKTSEWKEALDQALINKFPWGVRDHGLNLISDNGSQPTSVVSI